MATVFGFEIKTMGMKLETTGEVTAYLITMAALQLGAGKLGDQLGRRRFVLGGLIYFGLSSLLAALSPSLLALVFARV